ncbi:Vac14 protein [Saccharomycopsis crataegensis]|uniref:Vac14 protein n=1 Tax=Saccharomycopsis crataegensis TaxID=43959 RepID=A0AAV5QLA6_9ASCO|nr:Vac14 protein [Saccharomycopsis crataegensis]
MDDTTAKALGDRLYEKRRSAALSVEKMVRQLLAQNTTEAKDQISKIIDQLCQDYAYAVHQPNARNGGSIGLAAVAIALGSNHIAIYLDRIIMPVLACFSDQAAQVRYYACEALYNIAKVAKGEILVYFNDIFDVLCRLFADSENSIKNGANLFNRLIKDIVHEKAATYVSVIHANNNDDSYLVESHHLDSDGYYSQYNSRQSNTAFSLPKFIPVLKERLFTNNPYTRLFLVDWIMLLNSVPDLELISFLPNFLGGLLGFLTDQKKDVRIITNKCLSKFLEEIKRIVETKKVVEQHRLLRLEKAQQQKHLEQFKKSHKRIHSIDSANSVHPESFNHEMSLLKIKDENKNTDESEGNIEDDEDSGDSSKLKNDVVEDKNDHDDDTDKSDEDSEFEESEDESGSMVGDSYYNDSEGPLYLPLQDVQLNFAEIIRILIANLDNKNEEVQSVVLNWIETLLDITPTSFIPLICGLLETLVMILSSGDSVKQIKEKAKAIDRKLVELIYLYLDLTEIHSEDNNNNDSKPLTSSSCPTPPVTAPDVSSSSAPPPPSIPPATATLPRSASFSSSSSSPSSLPPTASTAVAPLTITKDSKPKFGFSDKLIYPSDSKKKPIPTQDGNSIYNSLVNIITSNLLNVDESTKLLLLDWLIMLHKKSAKLFVSNSLSKTFQILLKSLCGESAAAVDKDLILISEISTSANDSLFYQLMLDLVGLFKNDRKLLEGKGNFIIRKLCVNLNSERIYKSLAHVLFDIDHNTVVNNKTLKNNLGFISIMIQILNSNLITAPELSALRSKLRNLNTKEDWQLFSTLFKCWSYNSPACLSLCLLSQNYEMAYNLLRIFEDFEITVNLLIQLDILVQLLESPVFVKLRLQLLEPDKYPYLLKCLYGILMLLPQSNAFNTLQRRLNSINGYTINTGALPGATTMSPSTLATSALSSTSKLISGKKQKYNDLIKLFREVQQKHENVRLDSN